MLGGGGRAVRQRAISVWRGLAMAITLCSVPLWGGIGAGAGLGLVGGAVVFAPLPVAAQEAPSIDLAAWDVVAGQAEAKAEDPATPDADLRALRAVLADWRTRLLAAQAANSSRIATLKGQLAALGAAPTEGAADAPEIATRRAELTDQLARLEAPSIAAEEAWRRADGLIGEIDKILRDRQAQALMTLGPSPLNPLNWEAALSPLLAGLNAPVAEVRRDLTDPAARQEALSNLPVAFGFLLIAGALTLRGRRWMAGLRQRIDQRSPQRWRGVLMAPASLGQVIVPALGVLSATVAFGATRLGGPAVETLLMAFPVAGLVLFTALWLGERCFPPPGSDDPHLPLSDDVQGRARLLVSAAGWILAADIMLDAVLMLPGADVAVGTVTVVSYPLTLLGGLVLWRLGGLLRLPAVVASDAPGADPAASDPALSDAAGDDPDDGGPPAAPLAPVSDGNTLRDRLARLLGFGARACGLSGMVLSSFGYLEAAAVLVGSGILSLGLAGAVLVLQRLFARAALALAAQAGLTSTEGASDGLLPVMTGMGLILGSLPLFALIWGAQPTDLIEIWQRFLSGFQIGDARLAPADLLWFAIVFGAIYSATRLVQTGLRSSVLPRTTLDPGGQTAIVAGVGYVGVFLAAVAGISAAGFDLSSLAIVAGALSVGIGFGLQNIVSNFVAGIILLVERPVSEGDWIEVGGVQGTVRSISVRSTRIETFDRANVIVPNADLVSNQVTNWTRFNRQGRLIVPVGVAYGTDTRLVERILRDIARVQPGIQRYPEPTVVFAGFGASSLDFELRVILLDVNNSLGMRSALNHAIAERFVAERIEIPFPQQDLWLRNPETLRAAKE